MFVLSWTVSNVIIHIASSPSNVAQVFTARRESPRSRLYQQLAWNMTLRGGQKHVEILQTHLQKQYFANLYTTTLTYL